MQFMPINDIQLPRMGQVDHLAPYLSNLDVDDAVQSFGLLADKILQQQCQNDEVAPNHHQVAAATGFDEFPSYQSAYGTTELGNSPAPSDRSLSGSGSGSSSYSSGSYTPSSSGPASVASSCCDLSDGRRATKTLGRELRQKNASAAEKYRRRLKGRQWSLVQEMEREQARNARLRRCLDAKLSLYREFVDLLASNTREDDTELAKLGSRSLSTIMGEVFGDEGVASCPQNQPSHGPPKSLVRQHLLSTGEYDSMGHTTQIEFDEAELRQQLIRFQRIQARADSGDSFGKANSHGSTPDDTYNTFITI